MFDDFLERVFVNQGTVFFVALLILLALSEAGFRFGISIHRKHPKAEEGLSSSVHGAILGLLGLLLGFSFAMAVSRHDTRRSLAVEEANAIGTTWLRAPFLGEPQGTEVRALLRRYTELRLEASNSTDKDMPRLLMESNSIQNKLWDIASKAAIEKPDPLTVSFITTLNETIDLQASRLAAHRNHVPGTVWLLLLVVAGCGAWATGKISSVAGQRSIFNQIVFPLLISIVITLISDVDHPRTGFIKVSQQPIHELLDSMRQ